MNLRCRLLFIFFLVWGAVCAVRAFYLAGPLRQKLLERPRQIASHSGTVPARRGRLLDKHGIPIAWDETRIELYSKKGFSKQKLAELNRVLGFDLTMPDESGLLLSGLQPENISDLKPLLHSNFPIRIASRRDRVLAVPASARGKVEELEKKFDHQLSGTPGTYRVMLDRYRNWIPSTWELTSHPIHGKDVTADIDIENIGDEK